MFWGRSWLIIYQKKISKIFWYTKNVFYVLTISSLIGTITCQSIFVKIARGFISCNLIKSVSLSLRKKCPYSELFWSAFSHIRTEIGEIRYRVPLRIQSKCSKIRSTITLNTDTFHAAFLTKRTQIFQTWFLVKSFLQGTSNSTGNN